MKLFRYIVPLLLLSFIAQAQPPIKDGAILAEFSVSDSTKVYFSQGNLQYQASTNTWRFAEHQFDIVGFDNKNISEKYIGWIDLFAWGTSGYNGKNPYMTSKESTDYGDGENDIAGTNYDWGVYNKISNGGNQAGMWRTLTKDEWDYVISNRTDARYLRGTATINGIEGLILLPDNWILPKGCIFTYGEDMPNDGLPYGEIGGWTKNTYSASKWKKMEANGAVFLPAAGRYDNGSKEVGALCFIGYYWSSSGYDFANAYYWTFGDGHVGLQPEGIHSEQSPLLNTRYRSYGLSVRLVQDVKK